MNSISSKKWQTGSVFRRGFVALCLSLLVQGPLAAQAEEEKLPKNTVSLGVGFPIPAGGILGLERRFGRAGR